MEYLTLSIAISNILGAVLSSGQNISPVFNVNNTNGNVCHSPLYSNYVSLMCTHQLDFSRRKKVYYTRNELFSFKNRHCFDPEDRLVEILSSYGIYKDSRSQNKQTDSKSKNKKRKRGKRAGTRKQRKIDILVTTPLYSRNSNAVNRQTFANVNNSSTRHRRTFANIKRSNLVHVSCDVLHSKKNIKCGLLNVHSVNKKEHLIENLVIENDFDFFFMTETWLKPAGDEVRIQTMTPPTHNTMSLPRLTGLGGGISVTFKNIFSPYLKNDYHSKTFISFECSCSEIMIKGTKMSIFCIYRPPPSEKNKLTPSLFIKEFEDFLDSLSFFSDSHHTLLIGDFNLHYDAKDNTYVKQMLELFEIRNFSQCVTSSTQ